MLHSAWLSSYQAKCYVPLVANRARYICNVLVAMQKGLKCSFNLQMMFCLDIFLTN